MYSHYIIQVSGYPQCTGVLLFLLLILSSSSNFKRKITKLQLWLFFNQHLSTRPQSTTINGNSLTIHMRPSPTRQVHHDTSNILRPSQPTHGVRLGNLVRAARQRQQAVCHLAREKARADGVYSDAARAQLERQVTTQVQHSGLAGGVAVRALLAEGADAQARDAGGDEHAAGVVERGVLLQQRGEDADRVEDGFDVEVHDFCKGLIGVRVKGLAPGRAGVGKQDVDVVGVLAHFGEQAVDAVHGRRVGGHGDCRGVGGLAGQRVEDFACFLAGGGLAGGDEDLGAAGLHEAVLAG